MTFPFDPFQGLIVVRVALKGPQGQAFLRFALDTGATGTLVNTGMLVSIGYDPSITSKRLQVTTGSSIEYVPQVILDEMTSLGQTVLHFPVLCHTLPPSAGVDGLLGLDFFRGKQLSIDFQNGWISLEA